MSGRFSFLRNNSFLPVNRNQGIHFNVVRETVFPLQKFYIQINTDRYTLKIIDGIFTYPLSSFQEINKVYYPYDLSSYHISTGYERLIDNISSTIKIKVNFQENLSKNVFNSVVWNVSNRNINVMLYIRTGFNFPLNFTAGWEPGLYYFTNRQELNSYKEFKNRSFQSLFFYDLLFSVKKINFKCTNSTYISENIASYKNINTVSDFEIKIPFNKGQYFTELKVYNLYNTNFKRNFYNYEYLQIDDFISQRHRYFVLSFRFNI